MFPDGMQIKMIKRLKPSPFRDIARQRVRRDCELQRTKCERVPLIHSALMVPPGRGDSFLLSICQFANLSLATHLQIYYTTSPHYSHGEPRFMGEDPSGRGLVLYFLPANPRGPGNRERAARQRSDEGKTNNSECQPSRGKIPAFDLLRWTVSFACLLIYSVERHRYASLLATVVSWTPVARVRICLRSLRPCAAWMSGDLINPLSGDSLGKLHSKVR